MTSLSDEAGVGAGGDLPTVDEDLGQWTRCLTGPRLEILLVLSHGPACVGDITESLQLDYASISRALGHLRKLHCVADERCGRRIIYELEPTVTVKRENGEVTIRLALPDSRRAILILPAPSRRLGRTG